MKTPTTVKGSKMCKVYFLPHFTEHRVFPKTICGRKISKTLEGLDQDGWMARETSFYRIT